MLVREIQIMEERVPNEEKDDVTHVTSLVNMQESALIEGTLSKMVTTKTLGGMGIKGTTCSKEKGRLPLIEMGMEMVNLSRGQEIPGTVNLMLLIRKMNILLYLPSLLHLLPTPWIIS